MATGVSIFLFLIKLEFYLKKKEEFNEIVFVILRTCSSFLLFIFYNPSTLLLSVTEIDLFKKKLE